MFGEYFSENVLEARGLDVSVARCSFMGRGKS
jgi:hypothetical protein